MLARQGAKEVRERQAAVAAGTTRQRMGCAAAAMPGGDPSVAGGLARLRHALASVNRKAQPRRWWFRALALGDALVGPGDCDREARLREATALFHALSRSLARWGKRPAGLAGAMRLRLGHTYRELAGFGFYDGLAKAIYYYGEAVRLYAETLRALVRYLSVNSGDLEKGVMRIEPNISVRPRGSKTLGTKVEIKNLNSFRALERGVTYEIARQSALLGSGRIVLQETVGWDEGRQATYSQRSKEDAHDYRYFPEPDLPPLVIDTAWLERVRAELPELPWQRAQRLERDFGLSAAEVARLVEEKDLGEYFEQVVQAGVSPRLAFAWVTGELTSLMNAAGAGFDFSKVHPKELAALIGLVAAGTINQPTAKTVLAEMFTSGQSAANIVAARGLAQISDETAIARLVAETCAENPAEVDSFHAGKKTVFNFLFGQVMKKAGGKANPQTARALLSQALRQK